ncbi:hypothetical protein GCM10007338_09850 [Corynebacterium pelargi]|nr:hypothetical protein GCM10007338_09850 [Corynebacterium pelargi]
MPLVKNGKDGKPWAPDKKWNLVYAPVAALFVGIILRITDLDWTDDGVRPDKFSNAQVVMYALGCLAWWYLVMNPIYYLNRRWRLKNRTEEGNAYQDDENRWP